MSQQLDSQTSEAWISRADPPTLMDLNIHTTTCVAVKASEEGEMLGGTDAENSGWISYLECSLLSSPCSDDCRRGSQILRQETILFVGRLPQYFSCIEWSTFSSPSRSPVVLRYTLSSPAPAPLVFRISSSGFLQHHQAESSNHCCIDPAVIPTKM